MLDTHRDESTGPAPETIGSTSAFSLLRERVHQIGLDFSVYPGGPPADPRSVVLWDIGSFAVAPGALRRGSLIAWCLESPLVAHRAFGRLPAVARQSHAVLTFAGARTLLGGIGRFVPILYPNRSRDIMTDPNWSQREFLVMINSNKRAHPGPEMMSLRKPYRAARVAAAATLARISRSRGRLPADLYELRLDALSHFSGRPGFSLYGVGWDRPVWGRRGLRVGSSYRGPIRDKQRVLNRYSFSLCFENTSFPGYITEKIIDCFFAGTIPVYLGAPDVEHYIPAGSFIDARDHRDLTELEDRLRSIGPNEAMAFLETARSFVASDRFKPFTDEAFVDTFIEMIRDVAA